MKGEGPSAGGPRPGLPRRTAVLAAVFLLLAIGGGAYYYLMMSAPEPPPAPAPVKKKVAVKPAPAVASAPTAQPAATAPPAAGKPAASPPAAPSAVAKAPQVVKPAAATPVQGKEEKKTAPSAVAGKPAAPAAAATAAPETKPVEGTVAPPAPRGGAFTLVAGTFLNAEHQRDVERKIRKLGFKPQIRTIYRNVPMTRLRLGVYDPATAAAKRKELAGQIPELFSLKQGDKVALYAGSYQDLDQARSFADKLFLRNIHVEEEQAQLRMPLKTISFGSFASRNAAQQAAKRAAKAGLTADVVKR